MKILRISLKNLASLAGLHTVDFTREPLARAGLFAICGPTGSGKSTLLDALCLALYEKTPRLHSVRGSIKIPDGSREEITQSDPANLLRRGTGEGFAEVAFVGRDGQAYTARWMVRRAHHSPTGQLQATQVLLFLGNTSPGGQGTPMGGARKTETLATIEEKVGLNFAQFTRAVLLAQNDFATFLKSNDTERAEILQALTGTERYEAISKAVYQRHLEEKHALQQLDASLGGVRPLPEEERRLLQQSFDSALAAAGELSSRLDQRKSHQAWFEKRTALATQCSEAERALADATLRVELALPRQAELDRSRTIQMQAREKRVGELSAQSRLKQTEAEAHSAEELHASAAAALLQSQQARAAAEQTLQSTKDRLSAAQPLLARARELDAQMEPLASQKRSAHQKLTDTETRLAALRAKITELETALARVTESRSKNQRLRAELASFTPFAKDHAAWTERLRACALALHHRDIARTTLTQQIGEILTQRKSHAATTATHHRLRAEAEALQAAFEKARAEANAFDAPELVARRTACDRALDALAALNDTLQTLRQTEARLAQLQDEIAANRSSLEHLESRSTLLQTTLIPHAETAARQARHSYELATATVESWTLALRAKLVSGTECPLCGSTAHPYVQHAPGPDSLILQNLHREMALHEGEHRTLTAELAGIQKSAPQIRSQIALQEKRIPPIEDELIRSRTFAPVHLEAIALWQLDPSEREGATLRRIEELRAERDRITQSESAHAACARLATQAGEARDRARAAAEAEQQRLSALTHAIDVASAREQETRSRLQAAEASLETQRKTLEPLWSALPDLHEIFGQDPEEAALHFEKATTSLLEWDETDARLANELQHTEASLGPLRDNEREISLETDHLRLHVASIAQSLHATRQKRASVFEGLPAAEVERQFQDQIRTRETEHSEAANRCEKAISHEAAALQRLESARRSQASAREEAQTQTDLLDRWISEFSQNDTHPLDRAELDRILLRDPAWFEREQQELLRLEQTANTALGALQSHQKNLSHHDATRPTAEDLSQVLSEIQILQQRLSDASQTVDLHKAALLNDDQRLVACESIRNQLAERRKLAEPWAKLDQLIGSAQGDKFRNIAQRRTLDILLGYANAQLELLSARYRLERIPLSLNLLVIDRDMADEQRSVHSLSGGESFLVSLALALGLASLTSHRLSIQSLFIDEGFGSLDPETLGVATSALTQLEAQGRKVGVISHVAELTEAIPVRIRVLKGRGGASRLEVPGTPTPASESETAGARLDSGGRDTEALAQDLLRVLQAAAGSGPSPWVSSTHLRRQLQCTPQEFQEARERLSVRITSQGRSLRIAEPS
ncbi:MAG: putative Exonuclease SbcC [Verrucomicrobiota bacterium]|jgi:exonuclease SbcC